MVPYGKNGDFIREVREVRVWCGRTFSPVSQFIPAVPDWDPSRASHGAIKIAAFSARVRFFLEK